MVRKRVHLELIQKGTSRRRTFQSRKNNLMKKAHEFRTLCGVSTCVIIYDPEDPSKFPETYPEDHSEVVDVIEKYKYVSTGGKRKMLGLPKFFEDRKKKAENDLKKARQDNLKAKYPMPRDLIESLSKDQLRSLCHELTVKIDRAKSRLGVINGISTTMTSNNNNNNNNNLGVALNTMGSSSECPLQLRTDSHLNQFGGEVAWSASNNANSYTTKNRLGGINGMSTMMTSDNNNNNNLGGSLNMMESSSKWPPQLRTADSHLNQLGGEVVWNASNKANSYTMKNQFGGINGISMTMMLNNNDNSSNNLGVALNTMGSSSECPLQLRTDSHLNQFGGEVACSASNNANSYTMKNRLGGINGMSTMMTSDNNNNNNLGGSLNMMESSSKWPPQLRTDSHLNQLGGEVVWNASNKANSYTMKNQFGGINGISMTMMLNNNDNSSNNLGVGLNTMESPSTSWPLQVGLDSHLNQLGGEAACGASNGGNSYMNNLVDLPSTQNYCGIPPIQSPYTQYNAPSLGNPNGIGTNYVSSGTFCSPPFLQYKAQNNLLVEPQQPLMQYTGPTSLSDLAPLPPSTVESVAEKPGSSYNFDQYNYGVYGNADVASLGPPLLPAARTEGQKVQSSSADTSFYSQFF